MKKQTTKVKSKPKTKALNKAHVRRSLLEPMLQEIFMKGWHCASAVWEAGLIKEKNADWHRENYAHCEKKYIQKVLKDFA
jgi:hypothetical protein